MINKNNMEIETLYDLRKLLNSLSGEQLGQKIKVWGDGLPSYLELTKIEIVEEDLINPSGEFLEPVSVYKDEPGVLEEEPVVVHKGEIWFQADKKK
jgi:hypothetical protein